MFRWAHGPDRCVAVLEPMADIFLSYANEDREKARAVAGLLESAGCTVWWDRRIPAGRTWRSMIEEALRDMRCMVVLWSTHSVGSDWVKEEAEEARALGRLIPVLIEPVKPPVGFRSIQAADLTDWDGSKDSLGARQLIADLESLMGKSPPRKLSDFEEVPREKQPIPEPSVEETHAVDRSNRRKLQAFGTAVDSANGFNINSVWSQAAGMVEKGRGRSLYRDRRSGFAFVVWKKR